MKFKMLVAGLVAGHISMLTANAFADKIPVDLNDFYPEGFVTIAADGSSATLEGDGSGTPTLADAFLINDPWAGDPGIAVPASVLSSSFTYTFSEGFGADDELYALVFDGDTGDFIDDFYVNDTSSGTFSWDLSTLSPAVTTLGMYFQVSEYADSTTDPSVAVISDVFLTTESLQTPSPVPEPGTMILFSLGIAGLAGVSRKRRQ